MSADNFYVLTRHPLGGFALVMEFASNDEPTYEAKEDQESFPTVDAALQAFAEGQKWKNDGCYPKYYCEYGLHIDETIFTKENSNGPDNSN